MEGFFSAYKTLRCWNGSHCIDLCDIDLCDIDICDIDICDIDICDIDICDIDICDIDISVGIRYNNRAFHTMPMQMIGNAA
jgi:hypothetical protein